MNRSPTVLDWRPCRGTSPFGAPDPVEMGHTLYVLFLKASPSKAAPATMRNVTTVRKLALKMPAS